MLVGDSHAAQWRPAVDEVAERLGIRVVMSSFGGCPVEDVPAAREVTHQIRDNCAADRAHTDALIDELRPDAVLVAQADYVGLILDDDGEVLPVSEQRERWNEGLRELAVRLGTKGIPLGLLLDTPVLDRDPVECLSKGSVVDRCGVDVDTVAALTERAEGERAAVAAAGHGVVFDPVPLGCPNGSCPLAREGVFVYADNEHLTRTFARRLAPQLQPFIAALLSSP